jgi:hypothetical protein
MTTELNSLLVAPNGKTIVGTLETMEGCAKLDPTKVKVGIGQGEIFDFEHEGDTVVWWDTQKTSVVCGNRVFVDEDGNLWLERELSLRVTSPDGTSPPGA